MVKLKNLRLKDLKTITLQEAQRKELEEHLIFSNPNDRINTQYGELRIYEWMAHEQLRIGRSKGRSAELVASKGKLSLFVNPVGKLMEN